MRPGLVALLVIASSLVAGCGIRSTIHVVRAREAIERAEERGAAQNAAYEYTLAVRYLEKAREEAAHSRHGDAIDLARRAEELADQAVITMAERGVGGEAAPEAAAPEAAAPEPTAPEPVATEPSPVVLEPIVAPEPLPEPEAAP